MVKLKNSNNFKYLRCRTTGNFLLKMQNGKTTLENSLAV